MATISNTEKGELFTEIREVIEGNGTIPQNTKDRLILAAVAEILVKVACLTEHDERLKKLERYSIGMMAEKHPKATLTLAVLFFAMIAAIGSSDTIGQAILKLLGVQ